MTPIAIGSQLDFDEPAALGELADLSSPSAAATATPPQFLAPSTGSIWLLRKLFNSAGVRPGTCGGTLNAYSLVLVATASNASWSPIPLALRVLSAQLSGLNLLKLST